MRFKVVTRYEELQLAIKVRTDYPCELHLIVKCCEKPDTVFTNRTAMVNGDYTFYVRMPLSPDVAEVIIYNEELGENGQDTFQLIGHKKMHLEKRLALIDFGNPYVRSFLSLCQKFCYNAGTLPVNKIYYSDDGYFAINYLPQIRDENGHIINTPARVSFDAPYLEVSAADFTNYTIPMRIATLWHEFAHVYLNEDKHDESEADLNSLIIYLGLGYPRIEAHYVWADIFLQNPTDENVERYKAIEAFIKDFERKNFVSYEM